MQIGSKLDGLALTTMVHCKKRHVVGGLFCWLLLFLLCADRFLDGDTKAGHVTPSSSSPKPRPPSTSPPPTAVPAAAPDLPSMQILEDPVEPVEVDADEAPNIVGAARTRVVADHEVGGHDGSEHVALQDAAVELLTSQSACTVQTASSSGRAAYASSVYRGSDGLERHPAAHAFDGDEFTFFHSSCGLPMSPWTLGFTFDTPTAVATITLSSDAPADYPRSWELQGRSEPHEPYTTLLRVRQDAGISCSAALGASRKRQHTCDQPQRQSYEVRRPGDFREYRLLVHTVSNARRAERNCFRLNEVTFTGPCASSTLVLHLDASSLEVMGLLEGAPVREWRDQSGHGHHARRRGGTLADRSAPLALTEDDASADLEGVGAAAAAAAGDAVSDGPRLRHDEHSGRATVRFEYAPGAAFFEAAGLSVVPSDSMSVLLVGRTRRDGFPGRGSKVKPLYCLGEPAFWAGVLCIAGVVGQPGAAAYGGRGQPGEGEYLLGFTADQMDDGALHVLVVTVDGVHGAYHAWFDGAPAAVADFVSSATAGSGLAQIGGSGSSRTRRFHGDVAEVIHYNRVLSAREHHAIGHYLQHKYRIAGAYTDERMALDAAEAARGLVGRGETSAALRAALSPPSLAPMLDSAVSDSSADGAAAGGVGRRIARPPPSVAPATGLEAAVMAAAALPALGQRVQLQQPPHAGCLAYRGALAMVAREPCEDHEGGGGDVSNNDPSRQLWQWESAAQELRRANDPSQCLTWFADLDSFGVWACEFAHSEFVFEPLARRFCLLALPTTCLTQRMSEPMRAVAIDGGEATVAAGTGDADASESRGAGPPIQLHAEGSASCLQVEAPMQPLLETSCSPSPQQRWQLTWPKGVVASGSTATLHYASTAGDLQLCLDRFASNGGQWGTWPCEAPNKPNQRFLSPMAVAAAADSASAAATTSGGKLCTASSAGIACVQPAASDGAVLLSWAGEALCLALAPSTTESDSKSSPSAAVVAKPCSSTDPSQLWRFNHSGASFAPSSLPPGQCLELSSLSAAQQQLARVRPCLRIASGQASLAADPLLSKSQRFAWDGAARRYCVSLAAATRFEMRRCLQAAPQPAAITVAFVSAAATVPLGGGSELPPPATPVCLRAPGRFRMLEPARCAVHDMAQRWSFAPTHGTAAAVIAAGTFHWQADPGVCLRFFAEAASFAAWACAEQGGDAGGGDQRFELEEQPVGRAAASAPPQRFCVRLRPEGSGNKACVVVSPNA